MGCIQIGRLRVRVFFLLLVLWGLFILYGTTIPFKFSGSSAQVAAKIQQLVERPWYAASRMDIVSNVLLFLPWGILCTIWLAERGAGFTVAVLAASLSGLVLSGFVETLQLFTPTRITSLIDLATNFFGSVAGALVGWPLARWASPLVAPHLKRMLSRGPIGSVSLFAAAGLLLFELAPYDVSIDLGELKTSIKAARPIPFGATVDGSEPAPEPWAWTGETLTWMLMGGLFMLALREAGKRGMRAIAVSTATAVVLCLVIEVLQLLVRSRNADATSVVWSLVGAGVGAMVVARPGAGEPRRWIGPALAIWALIGMIQAWTPPNLVWPDQKTFNPEQLVPLLAYYHRTDIHALADLISQVLFFIPLGALLALRLPRISAWRCATVGFGFGLLLELGQLFMVDRICEVTDALTAGLGAVIGLWLYRWGQSTRDPSRGVKRYRVGPVNRPA